jgi:hypothetical protein
MKKIKFEKWFEKSFQDSILNIQHLTQVFEKDITKHV